MPNRISEISEYLYVITFKHLKKLVGLSFCSIREHINFFMWTSLITSYSGVSGNTLPLVREILRLEIGVRDGETKETKKRNNPYVLIKNLNPCNYLLRMDHQRYFITWDDRSQIYLQPPLRRKPVSTNW